ncbi:unnamed protein product [Eruca vesicaria subsp. sativa]|uniref:Uncharacterized protein n=1 Tax=Eruca vesicaria subsp. sativa TaxID=29727 RepID=A0ABC8K977_ERUVS|nr:unnamed protein product [Eruca vesicaria subsp. sativa]
MRLISHRVCFILAIGALVSMCLFKSHHLRLFSWLLSKSCIEILGNRERDCEDDEGSNEDEHTKLWLLQHASISNIFSLFLPAHLSSLLQHVKSKLQEGKREIKAVALKVYSAYALGPTRLYPKAGVDRKDLKRKFPKFIYNEDTAVEKTWKVLGWKFTQLNSDMEDATSQLKTGDTLNGAALRTDEVEADGTWNKATIPYVTKALQEILRWKLKFTKN